jgi:hypothetical protein
MKKKPLRINIFRFENNALALIITDNEYKGLMRFAPTRSFAGEQ